MCLFIYHVVSRERLFLKDLYHFNFGIFIGGYTDACLSINCKVLSIVDGVTLSLNVRFLNMAYIQTCVKRPYKTIYISCCQTGGCLLLYESSAESSCISFLHYFHSAISSHLATANSMSPGWMVTLNRFNCMAFVTSFRLTAFVVSTLQDAKKYIFISDQVLLDSIEWLLNKQNFDGSFTPSGIRSSTLAVCIADFFLM